MFDNIAGTYDFLNHLLSLNIDKRWRKKAIRYIGEIKPNRIIDIASGTGDFAIEALALQPDEIVGFDLSEKMIEIGRKKAAEKNATHILRFQKGDSENMPFDTNSFDAMTVGFGVRNFENLQKGLCEMQRILKPGGRLAILEVSQPTAFPIKQLYNIYFKWTLPLIGKIFSNDHRAYTYLPESVEAFPRAQTFVNILADCGFKNISHTPLTFGSCAMYCCEK